MFNLEHLYTNTIRDMQQRNCILQDQLRFYQNEYKENVTQIFHLQKENGSIMWKNYHLSQELDLITDIRDKRNEIQYQKTQDVQDMQSTSNTSIDTILILKIIQNYWELLRIIKNS